MKDIKQNEAISQQQLRKNIFSMIWPATMESVLQMMVGIVATAMVGRLGATAIGAVGLGSRIGGIVWVIFSAIGTGATVFVARSIGAKDYNMAKKIALQALIIGVFLVLTFTILIFVFARPILEWFGTDGDLLNVALRFLKLNVWGMPFMAIMQIVGASLRGAGNTRTPMLIAFIMNIINIVVSYCFIFGNFGFPEIGVNGAAIGAIVAQATGAVIAIYVLYRPNAVISLRHLKKYEISFFDIKRILNIGVPVAAQSLFWQFATIIIMRWIVKFGTISLAAHQLGLTAESLSFMPGVGFSIAATAFVGQSLGNKDIKLAERYVKELRRWCLIMVTITASCLFFLPKLILGLFTDEIAVIELAKYYLMMMALIQFPQQVADVMIGALRGAGMTKRPMLYAGLGLWLIRVPFSYLFGVVMGYGVIGVWSAMLIDIVTRFFLNLHLFNKGTWKNAELIK